MPHGRKRNRGNKGYDEEAKSNFPREREDESSYSRSSRQSDAHRRHSSGSARNSYDFGTRTPPPRESYWQRTDYGSSAGGYQDRYHKPGAETRESEGWSEPYSLPQREEWPPPPRYDHPSYQEYPPVSNNSYSQPWQDDMRHQQQQNSRIETSRWQREPQPVREPVRESYVQESDNGWATRHRRQSWNEPSTSSRFRSRSPPPSPAPANRQWEPAPSWTSSESQNHRSYHQQQQQQPNGHHNKKSSKNGKKTHSNGKSNGSRRGWKEEDDLNKYVFLKLFFSSQNSNLFV